MRLNQQFLIGLYIVFKFGSFPISKMFENIPSLPIQRCVRANRGIMILNENETYSVSIVTTPTLTFLHYSGGQLHYGDGMDFCVTVWILPLCLGLL